MNDGEFRRLTALLSSVVSFSRVDLEAAYSHFAFHTYAPGEYVFSSGDVIRNVYFVMEGIGRYFYIDAGGKERNKSLVRAGGAFASISSCVSDMPSPFFTQAITRCTTASIEYRALIELSQGNRNWAEFVRKLYENLVLKKEKREADFLLLSARERYEQFLAEFAEDCEQVPLRQVAMYLGVTDVTLSRIRREMGLT
ncbi:MAG: Crp/Fnr family transcriptional regulator [Pseudomonadales bacterium]|nr:Crp/Fnr family transcriptional regulator [Pseudomonadales bacterium]